MSDYPIVEVEDNTIKQIKFPDSTVFKPFEIDINFNGFGKISYADDSYFIGFVLQGIPTRFGLLESMGVTMYGAFEAAQLSGPGCLQFQDGSIIRSNFQSSIASGFGTAYQMDQQTYYQGEFQLNQPDGIGCLYSGDWKDVYNGKQNSCYFGYFMNGQPHGRGIALINDVLQENRFNRYEGYFVEGMRSGSGALFLANGDMLIGQFEYNEKQGIFLYVTEKGNFSLQYYEHNIVKKSYTPDLFYFVKPHELRCIVMQQDSTTEADFAAYVAYFKSLELKCSKNRRSSSRSSAIPAEPVQETLQQVEVKCVPILDTIWRYVRKLTVPLAFGLIDDRRVCAPLISEKIAEVSRNQTMLDYICSDDEIRGKMENGKEQVERTELFSGIEVVKSSLVQYYNLLEFGFRYYIARDHILIHRHRSYEGEDQLTNLLDSTRQELDPFFKKAPPPPPVEIKVESDMIIPKQINRSMSEVESFVDLEGGTSLEDMAQHNSNDSKQASENDRNSVARELDVSQLKTQPIIADDEQHTPAGLINSIVAMEDKLQHMPKGNNALDNQLLSAFLQVIDNSSTISTQSITELFRDASNHAGKLNYFQDGEEFFQMLLNQNIKQVDSLQITQQFGINALFSDVFSVLTFDGFLSLLLDCYVMFQCENFQTFIQGLLVPFIKSLMESIIQYFESDSQVSNIFAQLPEDKALVEAYIKKLQQMQESLPEKSVIEVSNLGSGMKSIPKSVANKSSAMSQSSAVRGKLMKSQQGMSVPKVLMRDTNFQLSEMENLLLRTSLLDKKLADVAKLQSHYERAIIFKKYINEVLEFRFTSKFAINITQHINFGDMTLLEFMQIFNFDYSLFNLPKLSDNQQFYVDGLLPFLLNYKKVDPALIFSEPPLTLSACFKLLENIKMTSNVYVGLMTSLALKADLPVKVPKKLEIDENNSQVDLDFQSQLDSQSYCEPDSNGTDTASNDKNVIRAAKLFDIKPELNLDQISVIFNEFMQVTQTYTQKWVYERK